MKIDIPDMTEVVDINKLSEITSPSLYIHGDIPHPEGLVSNEIFGVTTKSRKMTYAYIDLHGHFLHPHIFKAIRRMFRDIDKIVAGTQLYSLDKDRHLVKDENGDTGIEWLYEIWDKINWEKENKTSTGMRTTREELLKNYKKNQIFIEYQLVIPAMYRDVKGGTGNKSGETEDLNRMYSNLIRLSTLTRDKGLFDFQFNANNYEIQLTLVDIYNYFKNKLEKKNGLIRKYLMGKSCDFCTRTVITAPIFHANSPEEMFTDFRHVCIPIAQICSLCYPFMTYFVKQFIEREIIDRKTGIEVYNPATDEVTEIVELDNPESFFSDKYIKKMIDTFKDDPESRFNKIEVPVKGNKRKFLRFKGKRTDVSNTSEVSGIVNRYMTWTDLLYLAACDATKDKHCIVTRYPVLNEFGVFVAKIRVNSTAKTIPMEINGQLYRWYPDIDPDTPHGKIGSKFIDSCQFSNSYLAGLNGDYDGDQTTVKIFFTQEANEECEKAINSKSYFISPEGSNIRSIELEAHQTFYVLTKEPSKDDRTLSAEDAKYFINLDPKEITFDKMIDWFGNTSDIRNNNKSEKAKPSKYRTTEKLTIKPGEYKLIKSKEPVHTTLGRLIFNKIMIERSNLDSILDYQNKVFYSKTSSWLDNTLAAALRDDKIGVNQMIKYIDTRDWLGLTLHGVITTSFTFNTLVVPDNVKKLKAELLKKYDKELKAGDSRVVEEIEGALIKEMMKSLEGDIGLDLYNSGARGSVGNNLKNILISRGAVADPVKGGYDVITNALMDGLDRKDIPAHSNTILTGAYPKTVETADSGYMTKELTSAMQTEVLGPKDSDCGTKGYVVVTITKDNYYDFTYRYVIEGGKLVFLDTDTINKYIGKTVKLRSPMYCIGVGKDKHICNKCAGDFYYKVGKTSIGLATISLGTTLTQLNMKKFHDNQVHTQVIDLDDMLI